ncbi:MAG: hypothetical protein ACJ79V_00180, partial [Myxococcales bacterium]
VRLVPPGNADALAVALLEAAVPRPSLRVAEAPEDGDCLRRLLTLYGEPESAPAATPRQESEKTLVETPACAASAAS